MGVTMDLSRNICSLCCSLQPRAALTVLCPLSKLFCLLLDSRKDRTILVCNNCREQGERFCEWLLFCRENIKRLRQVEIEQERLLEQQQPDTTSDTEGRIEISLTENVDEDISLSKPENLITITKIDDIHGDNDETSNNIDDRIRLYDSPVTHSYSFAKRVPTDVSIQNKALNLVRRENTQYDSNEIDKESEYGDNNDEIEGAVSPPPPSGHHVPIIIPSLPIQQHNHDFEIEPRRSMDDIKATNPMSQEERRKHRNREASRRYREKARGDPELLKKMREQQNKRQKKYYARLKEKKEMKKVSQLFPSQWLSNMGSPGLSSS